MPLSLRPKTLRFAVTGLSGSGKTAFITSIIENLIAAAAQPVRLPFLRAASERRLVEVRPTRRQPAAGVPFPLLETVAALGADPPRWPGGTTELRRIDLSVLFHPSGLFGIANPPGRFANRVAEVTIEITDYPGEWLLDLPLLDQTFQHWSRMTMELAAQGVRAPLARDWLGFLSPSPLLPERRANRAAGLRSLSHLSGCLPPPRAIQSAAAGAIPKSRAGLPMVRTCHFARCPRPGARDRYPAASPR